MELDVAWLADLAGEHRLEHGAIFRQQFPAQKADSPAQRRLEGQQILDGLYVSDNPEQANQLLLRQIQFCSQRSTKSGGMEEQDFANAQQVVAILLTQATGTESFD
jgi:LPS O-antigen subunit length determinant protein (WzzB/FepE family)